MKVIKEIAAAELKRLFFSPVAFLLLIIYTFLIAGMFNNFFMGWLSLQRFLPLSNLTLTTFGSTTLSKGLYEQLVKFIYLFFPLLSMNLFSRDMGSGAFKLLLSAPVKNSQIVLGKYLALVVFSLVFTGLLSLFSLYGFFRIENVDVPVLLCGLLGIFLVCCIYSAVGLFLSSLTTYPIVAALLTLTLLMVMTFIKDFWQEYPIVRDIAYWLSTDGRAYNFIYGIIGSEDLIYFITMIAFFLALTTIRLHGSRAKSTKTQMAIRYSACVLIICVVGLITSKPHFKAYLDVTRSQVNTLAPESQRVMKKMDGGLAITTYVNMLEDNSSLGIPRSYKRDVARFDKYARFKPETRLNYVYYYKLRPGSLLEKLYPNASEKQIMDSVKKNGDYNFDILPYEAIKDKVDLSGENYRFVRVVERDNGQKTFLRVYDDIYRVPDEKEITAAMKRLVEKLPVVGFVTGHGERASAGENDRGYNLFAEDKTFRHSLINNGFDFEPVLLDKPVPDYINILVVADAKKPFSEIQMQHFQQYINRGGNLFLAGDPGRQEVMNTLGAPLGVQFLPGVIAHSEPNILQNLVPLKGVKNSQWGGNAFKKMNQSFGKLMMNGVSDLKIDSSKGFNIFPLFSSDTVAMWNELETENFFDDSAVFNPAAGEVKKVFTPIVALDRNINGRSQKILVTADADWISNLEITTSRRGYLALNFDFVNLAFYWLSNSSVPVNTARPDPIDNRILSDKDSFKVTGFLYKWGLPALLLGIGMFIWIRRKGR